jgi:hypothetical protein
MERLSFDDLSLFSAAFEVRFDDAYPLWDRAGLLWNKASRVFPGLERRHVDPSRVVFNTTEKPERELTVELNRLGFVEFDPDRQLRHFADGVDEFAGIATELLEIEQYQRTGLRLMFRKQFSDATQAATSLSSTQFYNKLSSFEKLFGVAGPIIQPELVFRREDGKNGFALRLKVDTQKLDIGPVLGWPDLPLPIAKTRHWLVVDVDCYIQAPVLADALVFGEWIRQTAHIIRRDSTRFLEEL